MIAGYYVYLDPEYQKDGKLSKKSDIYSFGVVLLEILTRRLAYDFVYTNVNEKGLAPIARDHFEKRTVMEIVDHKIKEETDEHVFSLSKGPNKESLDRFLEITFRCVAETQAQRPTIEVVIKELKKSENHKDNLKLSLEDVKLATQDFSKDNMIGPKDFGNVYRGVVTHAHGPNIIAAKRLNRKSAAKDTEFMTELEILMEYKHERVIALVGYCNEKDEKIIVYEYASKGSLDKYLSDDSLTWLMRLKICIDIASGLAFLHGTASSSEMVIHGDISSSNILLFDDWKAKITGFGLSLVCPTNQNVDYVIDNVMGTIGYRDPLHSKTGFLTKESDIFSLGAVLFDILCGKLSSEKLDDEYLYLPFLAKHYYHVDKLDKLVFKGIKQQIVPQSFITFAEIAFQCIHHMRERRPTAHEVVIQLEKALEFQVKHEEIGKLKEVTVFVKSDFKVSRNYDELFWLGEVNGKKLLVLSAKAALYKFSIVDTFTSKPPAQFKEVIELLPQQVFHIKCTMKSQLLSPDTEYVCYLLFTLSENCQGMHCPVKVRDILHQEKKEAEFLYFITPEPLNIHDITRVPKQREDGWMEIQLWKFKSAHEFKDVSPSMNMRFTSLEGTMSGLIVCGLEFRPL
ncbi:kinase-like domain, phloem protein 2-like protein [Tanacetum coccineum]